MARANLTLLVIDAHVAIRADFAAGRTVRPINVWRNTRPDTEDLGLLVEATAHDGGRLRGKVWVIWSELFAQSLRLDAKSMGLKGDELRAGLAFEAEPLSGINGLDSLVAFEQTSAAAGEREYWVLQARRDDVENVRDAISRLGGRFAGIVSPAGLAIEYPVNGASEEIWSQWLTDVATLFAAAAKRSAANRPVAIEPPTKPLTSGSRTTITVGLAILVLLCCTLHYKLMAQPWHAKLRADVKASQDFKSEYERIGKETVQVKNSIEQSKQYVEHLKKTLDVVALQRERIAGFLAMVAQERSDELVILRIDCPGGAPVVHGLSMKPHLAADFAHKMGERGQALGWQPLSPSSTAKNLLANGGPWSFTLEFRDVLPAPDPMPEPKAAKKGGR